MAIPDFFQCHCTNTDMPECPNCGRDFAFPVEHVKAVFRTKDNLAKIYLSAAAQHPACGGLSFVKELDLEVSWTDLLNALDGKVKDLGNVEMK